MNDLEETVDCKKGKPEYPLGWGEMEIEAKWKASRNAFERIVGELSDGVSMFGYQFDVRWGGIPRRFVDRYFDAPLAVLKNASHSLRHRTRATSSPRASSRVFSVLLNSKWEEDWQRIQYKSTPIRQGAVWFRKEVGDCRIWDADGGELCPNLPTADAVQIIRDPTISHEAITFMQSDHPSLDRSQLTVQSVVTDFRYRIEFKLNDEAVLETSLDHLISENLLTGEINRDYEVELELVASSPGEADLAELFRVTNLLQKRYDLVPSTMSKGGNDVPESTGRGVREIEQ